MGKHQGSQNYINKIMPNIQVGLYIPIMDSYGPEHIGLISLTSEIVVRRKIDLLRAVWSSRVPSLPVIGFDTLISVPERNTLPDACAAYAGAVYDAV